MAADLVWIAKIGEKTLSDKFPKNLRVFDGEFLYKNSQFKLLIEIDIGKVIRGTYNLPAYLSFAMPFFPPSISNFRLHS